MKITREIKIAALSILTLVAFIWGFNYLKGTNLLYKRLILYAVYDEVGGLTSANPIYLRGFKVGQVNNVYLEGNGSTRIVARLMINEDLNIPVNSVARIHSSDLMGSKAIELILGDSPIFANQNDTLLSDIQATLQEEVNRQVQPIRMKAEELLSSLDTLVVAIQAVFDEESRANISQTFQSISGVIKSLEGSALTFDSILQVESSRIGVIIENIESISTNLKGSNEDISALIANLRSISDSLADVNMKEAFSNLESSVAHLNSIVSKIDEGEGSLGLLVNDPVLYEELAGASRELNQLFEDMKLNPGRYVHFSVFGNRAARQTYTPIRD